MFWQLEVSTEQCGYVGARFSKYIEFSVLTNASQGESTKFELHRLNPHVPYDIIS